ncbi:oligosaccharide flippase family protein [Diaphorobacter sp. JS3051]|uniref:oligosaccharide flippase family protein n=1 Tax=Diaphorobacter sp. JS3051 TaxID=2792224 RepID=UPI0018CAF8D7|nr:oligosaccharide flippase family protein [Diaphorobacter sp. JS3051]QPN33197.1 oligosaccharide flippase family protein [Diaphorobacter sp. JS3051]
MPNGIRTRLAGLMSNGFARNVGVLVGGTAFAQALSVLILPLLTRLYSPDDFTVLAAYASILAIFAGIACLRLEIAIPLPESDDEAANLLALAVTFSSMIAALLGLAVWIYSDEIIRLIAQPGLKPYLWLLPFGVWLSGIYAALQYWATRHKDFGLIARTRLSQATSSAAIQLSCGWAGFTPIGLILGQLCNVGAGVIRLGADIFRNQRNAIASVRHHTMLASLRRYERFPKYSTLEALANGANIQLPVLIIASLAIGPEAGFLMLASRVISAPMSLIGGAISQVYLSRAPAELRQGSLSTFTVEVLNGLIRSGVGPILFIGIIAPAAFPIIFGPEWERAGEIVSWMTPWFIFQFLASPISMILHVTENQKKALLLQVCGLFLRVGAVTLAAQIKPTYIVEAYVISGLIFYAIYLRIALQAAKVNIKPKDILHVKNFNILSSWVTISILAIYIIA